MFDIRKYRKDSMEFGIGPSTAMVLGDLILVHISPIIPPLQVVKNKRTNIFMFPNPVTITELYPYCIWNFINKENVYLKPPEVRCGIHLQKLELASPTHPIGKFIALMTEAV
ncbi:hypothetical protein L798_10075 [Zootermopsis nevadensis]|uniref:Uncharacterized protein n=1 Tax=Zootermopsis nevadensis TaxID=136037 RepID=A0A067R248_ZOONE|nr:hypothetical protein L798_10075 [Zootermopsis nevadensis]